jgi:hypothetical protein
MQVKYRWHYNPYKPGNMEKSDFPEHNSSFGKIGLG